MSQIKSKVLSFLLFNNKLEYRRQSFSLSIAAVQGVESNFRVILTSEESHAVLHHLHGPAPEWENYINYVVLIWVLQGWIDLRPVQVPIGNTIEQGFSILPRKGRCGCRVSTKQLHTRFYWPITRVFTKYCFNQAVTHLILLTNPQKSLLSTVSTKQLHTWFYWPTRKSLY